MMSSHLVTRCCGCWHAFSEYIIIEESGAGIAEEQRFVGGKKDGVGVGLYASKKKASAASKREACDYWRKWRRPELVVWDPCQWPMVNGQWSAQYPCDYDLGQMVPNGQWSAQQLSISTKARNTTFIIWMALQLKYSLL
jgi:hypothetical protein